LTQTEKNLIYFLKLPIVVLRVPYKGYKMATTGIMSSLGIGSGVLTADVIDKLKENEKTYTVDPIKKKLELADQRKEALDLLSSLMTTLEASARTLSDDTLFASREVKGANDDIEVEASDGVELQSFTIDNVSLAKNSVQESESFTSSTASVASGSGSMSLDIGSTSYKIEYDSSMTLEDLKDKINDVAGDDVTASILQLTDDSYSLIVKADNTGEDNNITLSDNSGKLDTKLLNKVLKSDSFSSTSDKVATSDGSLHIDVGGVSSDIDYKSTTSLTQLRDAINSDDTLKGKVFASIENVAEGEYKLVLNAIGDKDGADIEISDNSSGLSSKLIKDASDMSSGSVTEVQSAKNATFEYNGISMSRSSNKITNIITGVTINLLKDNASANISIELDRDPLKEELKNFADSYNSMLKQLDSMTLADTETEKIGVFNGDNTIRNLGREVTKIITQSDENGRTLTQYGFSLNQNGTLSFNESDFDKKMDEDTDEVQLYLSGKTSFDEYGNEEITDGIFDTLYEQLKSYIKYNGVFKILDEGLTKEKESLQDNYDNTLKLLNQRYDTMTHQFIEYDGMISRLNNQANSLMQQIDMAMKS